jgi:CheY-like chemotaxis protein
MDDIHDSRILLVNDHTGVCEWQKKLLSDAGFSNIDIDSGYKAQKILKKGRHDLLIQDLQRPELSGYYLYKWMKEKKKLANIPIIIATVSESLWVDKTGFTSIGKQKFELTYEMSFQDCAPSSMFIEGYICLGSVEDETASLISQADRILRFWTGVDRKKEYERRNRYLWPVVRKSWF